MDIDLEDRQNQGAKKHEKREVGYHGTVGHWNWPKASWLLAVPEGCSGCIAAVCGRWLSSKWNYANQLFAPICFFQSEGFPGGKWRSRGPTGRPQAGKVMRAPTHPQPRLPAGQFDIELLLRREAHSPFSFGLLVSAQQRQTAAAVFKPAAV